jgi:hypothetical protein
VGVDDTTPLAPTSTGSGDDQPPPPNTVSPLESVTIRWLAAQIPAGLNYVLHLTKLDATLHITAVTESGVVNAIYFVIAAIGIWKVFVQRVRAGRDPQNTNVPAVKLPDMVKGLIKQ